MPIPMISGILALNLRPRRTLYSCWQTGWRRRYAPWPRVAPLIKWLPKCKCTAQAKPPLSSMTPTSLSGDAVASIVHKTITERIEDGQLDECAVRGDIAVSKRLPSVCSGAYITLVSPILEKPQKRDLHARCRASGSRARQWTGHSAHESHGKWRAKKGSDFLLR